jgi:outer membrane protein assembly factor BamB
VLSGSYDHFVYALAAADGRLIWKEDTHGAVVSTPAVAGKRAVIGNRCYDLLGLDLATGKAAWKRYIWMSWVESSATIRDGVAYVGSSDAAALFAVDAQTGKRVWTADVFGWAWGQPAVSKTLVYTGTSSQVGYIAKHGGALLALDRASGTVVWRHALAAPDSGAYGIPGSPALGEGRVYAGALDGKVYAFPQ